MLSPAEVQPTAEVSEFDRSVYQGIANYAWNEPECHPSQETVARDIGCARESVNRSVRRLIEAGWLTIKEKRWSPRKGWCHNVYELHAPYVVGVPTIKRIVRRAHNTAKRRAKRLDSRPDHTNTKCRDDLRVGSRRGKPGWCGCAWCKPDKTSTGRPPPPVRALPLEEKLRATRFERLLNGLVAKGIDPPRAYAMADGLEG